VSDPVATRVVEPVSPSDPAVAELLAALTGELAAGGYGPDETFGYSIEQLEQSGVRLFGAHVEGRLVGVGGIEVQGDGIAELKRFYVVPAQRGVGVVDEIMRAVLEHARASAVRTVRLETGDKQRAAIAMYRRHGFREIPRFGPYVESATSVCMQLDVH
jgi:putative acetyltransferase